MRKFKIRLNENHGDIFDTNNIPLYNPNHSQPIPGVDDEPEQSNIGSEIASIGQRGYETKVSDSMSAKPVNQAKPKLDDTDLVNTDDISNVDRTVSNQVDNTNPVNTSYVDDIQKIADSI